MGPRSWLAPLVEKYDRNPLIYSHATFLNKQVRGAVGLASLSEKNIHLVYI